MLLSQRSLASLSLSLYLKIGFIILHRREAGPPKGERIKDTGRYCAPMEAGTATFQRSLASLIVTESVTVFKNRIYRGIGEKQIPPKEERIKDTWTLRLHGSRYATFSKVTSISDSDRVCHCI